MFSILSGMNGTVQSKYSCLRPLWRSLKQAEIPIVELPPLILMVNVKGLCCFRFLAGYISRMDNSPLLCVLKRCA